MSAYQPFVAPIARYFFTVRLRNQQSDLLTRHIDLFRHSVLLTQQGHPFIIDDAVILPNRVHMIWSMPPGDVDYGLRWQQIKTTFSRHVPTLRRGRATAGIWQRRYWEQRIENAADYQTYAALIAEAPVTDGLVRKAGDWPYCTAAKTDSKAELAVA